MSRSCCVRRAFLFGLPALVSLAALGAASAAGADPPASVVLTNAKVITVDDRFGVAQAVAVRGERIIAVGTNREIETLAGPNTRRIDVHGKALIPGLIDNHLHLLRGGRTWSQEVRLDGVESRKQALQLLRNRVAAVKPGDWVYTLGGWTMEQFADDAHPLTRVELDEVAPNNPVLLQASYYEAYLNTRALEMLGVRERYDSGRVPESEYRALVAKLPMPSPTEAEASARSMIQDLNRMGITAVGSIGCEEALLPSYRKWEAENTLNIRVFCIDGAAASTPAQADEIIARLPQIKLFQGDNYIDHIMYGESVYASLHDPMFVKETHPRTADLEQWGRIATEIAKNGLTLHVHANVASTIDAFLDQIQLVAKEHPVKNLRWVFTHLNQASAAQLARMRDLGLYAAVSPWGVINSGIDHRLFGDETLDWPPLRDIQASGVMWGFGSDGTRANQVRPFTTLWWAVTGKMVGGKLALRQTISREDALIAYTRRNAFFLFQEGNLGAIQPGKLADLLVLDRDFLKIPADDIKNIRPTLTMVGGRIVYDATAAHAR